MAHGLRRSAELAVAAWYAKYGAREGDLCTARLHQVPVGWFPSRGCRECITGTALDLAVPLLVEGLPGLDPTHARQALVATTAAQTAYMDAARYKRIATHLASFPDALVSGSSTTPVDIARLISQLRLLGYHAVADPSCADCGHACFPRGHRPDGLRVCPSCTGRRLRAECAGCGKVSKICTRTPDGSPLCLTCRRRDPRSWQSCDLCQRPASIRMTLTGKRIGVCCYLKPHERCSVCGFGRAVSPYASGKATCDTCLRQRPPECHRCGLHAPTSASAEPPTCLRCLDGTNQTLQGLRHPDRLPRQSRRPTLLDLLRSQAAHLWALRPPARHRPPRDRRRSRPVQRLLARTGHSLLTLRPEPTMPWRTNRDDDLLHLQAPAPAHLRLLRHRPPRHRNLGRNRCSRCVLADRLTELLGNQDDRHHLALQGLFDTIIGTRNPEGMIGWLRPHAHRTAHTLLTRLGDGTLTLDHDTFDALNTPGNGGTANHLDAVLTANGILPPRDLELARLERDIPTVLANADPQHRRLLRSYATWDLARKARHNSHDVVMTQSRRFGIVRRLIAAVRFLAWLAKQDLQPAQCNQRHLDDYLLQHPTRRPELPSFLTWAARRRHMRGLEIIVPTSPLPTAIAADDDDGWTRARALLHDEGYASADRVAGLLVLLFGQRPGRISRLDDRDVITDEQGTWLKLGTTPIHLPEPLDAHVRDLLLTRRSAPAST